MPTDSFQLEPVPISVDDVFHQALAYHRQGKFQEAEQLYLKILQVQPNHADANHNLGMLTLQAGQAGSALPLFKAALEANPNQGQCWLSYIDALILAGECDTAKLVLKQGQERGLQGDPVNALLARLEGMDIVASLSNHSDESPSSFSKESPQHSNKNEKPKPAKTGNSGKQSISHNGRNPSNQEINKLMGFFNQGYYSEAVILAKTMVEQFPRHGLSWGVLGASFKQMKNNTDALLPLQKAAELSPKDPDLHSNLAVLLLELGRPGEAEASCRRALKMNPSTASAHYNLGNILKKLERPKEAEASYRQAIRILPKFAEAHCNLGSLYISLGRQSEAKTSCERALQINPHFAEAHCNLGVTLKNLGQLDNAMMSYRQTLKINPDFDKAHNNLGSALQAMGRLDDAVASFRRALEINPVYTNAYINLGNIMRDLGRFDDAVTSLRHALDIEPDLVEAHSELLLIRNLQANIHQAVMLEEARYFGNMLLRRAHPFTNWRNSPEPARCLRVGLISGDLRNHPVGYFIESILAELSSNYSLAFQFIAYSSDFQTDSLTQCIKACCQEWYSVVGLSDEKVAQLIRDDKIDILIDLSGHTAHNRLSVFAWKPAPVQVSWLGYFATTGIAAIDYLIADPWVLPESEEIYFTEKIWRMPETRLCFTQPNVEVAVSSLPVLSNGFITFGCFNHLSKMNDEVVALWSRVLESVPNSQLFLKAKQFEDASVRRMTIERFSAHGICNTRIILEGFDAREKYFTAYNRVDIALDPFPYPGGTTSVEGLWMGVPVLTLAGERFLSRQGIGILMNAGLPEWIAADADDYVSRAISHAAEVQKLSNLRNRLRQQVLESPLFDARRFATNFESVLRGMWTRWCDQQVSK